MSGTRGYGAPEGEKVTKKSGVFSSGMVALGVVCGHRPSRLYSTRRARDVKLHGRLGVELVQERPYYFCIDKSHLNFPREYWDIARARFSSSHIAVPRFFKHTNAITISTWLATNTPTVTASWLAIIFWALYLQTHLPKAAEQNTRRTTGPLQKLPNTSTIQSNHHRTATTAPPQPHILSKNRRDGAQCSQFHAAADETHSALSCRPLLCPRILPKGIKTGRLLPRMANQDDGSDSRACMLNNGSLLSPQASPAIGYRLDRNRMRSVI